MAKTTVMNWWSNKTTQERNFVKTSAAILALLTCLLVLYVPWFAQTTALRQEVQHAAQLAAWLTQQQQRILSLRGAAPASNNPEKVLTQLLVKFNFLPHHAQLQTLAAGRTQLTLRHVAFDQLMTWLGQVNHSGLFKLEQLTVQASISQGYVDAELQLQANPR